MTLAALRDHADAEWNRFITVCHSHGFADEWAAYRAEKAGAAWHDAMNAAHRDAMRALHAFYGARDGERGVLGGRGL